jgi:hypothetical protein
MIGTAQYLNLPTRVITPALLGRFNCGHERIEYAPDFVVFHHGEANVPTPAKALALQHELVAAGLLPTGLDPALPRRLFRDDLHREFLNQPSTHDTPTSPDLRGVELHTGSRVA